MGFLRRMIMADAEPTANDRARIAAVKNELDQTRGEYRQKVQRVETNVRLMKAWENANRMVRD